MTELLLTQQLESPSGTGRVDPEGISDSQAPNQTNGMPTSQPPHSHWQIWTGYPPHGWTTLRAWSTSSRTMRGDLVNAMEQASHR